MSRMLLIFEIRTTVLEHSIGINLGVTGQFKVFMEEHNALYISHTGNASHKWCLYLAQVIISRD